MFFCLGKSPLLSLTFYENSAFSLVEIEVILDNEICNIFSLDHIKTFFLKYFHKTLNRGCLYTLKMCN